MDHQDIQGGSRGTLPKERLCPHGYLLPVLQLKKTLWRTLKKNLRDEYIGLTKSLPDDVQILTLEHWEKQTILLRFENILEADEIGAKDITIDLKGLFTSFEIISLNETTLGANQLLEENSRLKWNVGDCLPGLDDCINNHVPKIKANKRDRRALKDLLVTLSPMQIRTFLAKVNFA